MMHSDAVRSQEGGCVREHRTWKSRIQNKKVPRGRKEQPEDGWIGLSNDTTLRMRWREALQMMRPSECMWPGRADRRAGTRRRRANIESTQPIAGGVDVRNCERTCVPLVVVGRRQARSSHGWLEEEIALQIYSLTLKIFSRP